MLAEGGGHHCNKEQSGREVIDLYWGRGGGGRGGGVCVGEISAWVMKATGWTEG